MDLIINLSLKPTPASQAEPLVTFRVEGVAHLTGVEIFDLFINELDEHVEAIDNALEEVRE